MMIEIIGWLAFGVVMLVGHMTCAVLASGVRSRRADELADAWYRQKAEARVLGLREDDAADAVREAEMILKVAR